MRLLSSPAQHSAPRAARPRCNPPRAVPQDDSTFGKPSAPKEVWSGHQATFRASFLAEAASPAVNVATAALLLAGEDDAVASRTAVPLPVEPYLRRIDAFVADFVASSAAFGDDLCTGLDAFLYTSPDGCRFRVPTAWSESFSPYRTCAR